VTIGPRASFASRDYIETYFGVTPAEAARSALTAYAPGGGFKGVGGELTTRYEFMPQWNVIGVVTYERLIGDAADSPIVQVGNENQFTFKLGITHTFGLRLAVPVVGQLNVAHRRRGCVWLVTTSRKSTGSSQSTDV
jgi:MipA family protein